MTTCRRPFDEALLSGYLDDALIQLERQRVRVHLEDCPECRELLDGLRELRETARTTRFAIPDIAWDERPLTPASRLLRGAGWTLAIVTLSAVAIIAVVLLAGVGGLGAALGFGGMGAVGMLFLSVLFDRLRVARTDPYREVHK